MAGDETRLLERLLSDPDFRTRFRSDPEAAAREAGLELGDGLGSNGGNAMQTLDFRESKSSFAGALMAAAAEGFSIYELAQHVLPGGIDEAHAAVTSGHWDPDQFGQAGTGGPETADTAALLDNHNVTFDATGIADLKAGRVDPRVVSVLEELAKKHKLTISAMVSDHDKLTSGGSISNHYYGRAVDIATVDGRPVTPGNLAARRIAVALSSLPASIRPTEIGSPWQLPGAAYFSDSEHQNHLHVAFDDPIAANWTPPPDLSAAASPPPVAAAEASPPAQPVAQADAAKAAAIVNPLVNPDDLEGNLDDEDAGGDEEDGSNEDEPDEGGGEDDDGGDDEEDGGDDEDQGDAEDAGGDDGQDAPGEGSNGEDATDDNANSSDSPPSGGSDSGSSDSGSSDSGSSDPSSSGAGQSPDLGAIDPTYPGDNAPQSQIATWMADAAEKRGLPRELPVMAALTESSLRNLNYGDADSVGFFQMRTSIWDQGQYAGYGQHPAKQLQWFLDQAEAIKKQRLARGLSVDDPNQYGQWVADIERPAAQYRGRYQLRLEQARGLLAKI
jgi:hypothetical protein